MNHSVSKDYKKAFDAVEKAGVAIDKVCVFSCAALGSDGISRLALHLSAGSSAKSRRYWHTELL